MADDTELMEDLDALIEYCPESPDIKGQTCNDCDQNTQEPEPPPRIIFVCSLCLRQYDLKEDLRGHMIEYHKCVPIDRVTKADTTLKLENNEDCKEEKPAMTMAEANLETRICPEIKPLPFKDFRLILRQRMNLKCTAAATCVYKFVDEERRENHVKCHVQGKCTFKCYICAMSINNWRRCTAHLWKSHQIDVDLLQCPVCEFKSYASALVWRHMRVHKKWRPRVMRSLKAVKRKRLQQAQIAATNAVETEKPKPVVRQNKYYSEKTCEICERKFVNGKTLSKHIKTVHNKIKPFICNVCGKKMSRKASLIIHMRQHTGEKPLHCKTCKFSTRDPSVLHKHQMRHNRESAKLKCSLCDFSCIQSNAFKHHMRLNHAENYKKIACDLCSYVTVNEEKLKIHKEDHRKGLIRMNEDSQGARKPHKNNEASADCFLPLESIDSLPHEPAVDTGGVTIPAPSEDSQFPTYFHSN
ncbi:oocyte zinc finger protein XlCOF28 [Musca domestica]|uniref:Oocyte zinc finger protein XlCOF28 n=1 Tax=Musca domestica TaxID=7370 RepID=A0A9J7D3T8_MUSDO|nr:oocyte zinc finger protein XlCOF28 [Musca domestica]XP_019891062.2 oocyte zinc finger protein XlCOF28 [Musca domestica]